MSTMIRILVIDDEFIIRTAIERVLNMERVYSVTTVKSGNEGIKKFEEEEFDLVLLNIKMSDMDGLEVLKSILSNHPEQKVIIISGYSTLDMVELTKKLGACSYLEKPFTPERLLNIVQTTLMNKNCR